MKIIFGNFGDNTLALMQWALDQKLTGLSVISVDTGWAAEGWLLRVEKAQTWARANGFHVERLTSSLDFASMVRDRGQFPSQKFQWCAGFLKGLPLISYLDQVDPLCQAEILLGSRRADSRLRHDLPEIIEDSEHYGGRTVHYPLCKMSNHDRDALVKKTGFELLKGRSLECQPCIHSSHSAREKMAEADQARLQKLETDIAVEILLPETGSAGIEQFDLGCGAPYACGE